MSAGGLAIAAYRADVSAGWPAMMIAADLAAGLCVVVLGLISLDHRHLVAWTGLGLSWLLGSSVPALVNLHRGVMVIVVVVVTGGLAITGRRGWAVPVALAAPLVLGVPPVVAAMLLVAAAAAVAVRQGVASRAGSGALVVYAASEVVVATSLGFGIPSAGAAQIAYPLGFVVAASWTWLAVREHQRLLEGLAPALDDLRGHDPYSVLTEAVATALRDPSVSVTADSGPDAGRPETRVVIVDGEPWARVSTTSTWLRDEVTWRWVHAAVARVGARERLLVEQQRRAAATAASRTRLLDAADLERTATGATLRRLVVGPLRMIADALDDWTLVADEVRGAAEDIEALLVGVAPTPLGDGALASALERLASRLPLSVELDVSPSAVAPRVVEETAYAVCAEALTNVLKHADASQARVHVRVTGDRLVLAVEDDGVGTGGAGGSGLSGLADRVSGRGGTFRVVSTPGRGTTVTACLPVTLAPAVGGR